MADDFRTVPVTGPLVGATQATDEQKRVLGLLPHRGPHLPDQEIRARALECAVKIAGPNLEANDLHSEFWKLVEQFEAYIRDER